MQTINFQCGHCRNVMGVGAAYLGKQVRCPHCQQVVLAPMQAPTAAAAGVSLPNRPPSSPTVPAPPTPAKEEAPDSIFGEHVDDDLFSAPPKSKVELPPPPSPPPPPPNMPLEPTVFQVPVFGPQASTAPSGFGSSPQLNALQPAPPYPAAVAAPAETAAPAAEADAGPAIQAPTLGRPDGGMLMTSVFLVLVAYSLLTTFIILLLLWKIYTTKETHPLEMLPDLGNPPSKRVGTPFPEPLAIKSYERVAANTPLPPHLITTLGNPLQIGDLEVTPLRVEQKRVLFKYRLGSFKSELAPEESLVLQLQLKNISKNSEFRPVDLAFDHFWKDGQHPQNTMPYTYLEVAGKRFCSPLKWNPAAARKLPVHVGQDEFVEGQEEGNKILLPGEQMKTVIVTDPGDNVPQALRNHRGKLLWRVQLRRGLVELNNKLYSATAVIGVEFDKEQIEKK